MEGALLIINEEVTIRLATNSEGREESISYLLHYSM